MEAWRASIERAEQASATGGLLVSRHFCRLCQDRVKGGGDQGEELGLLQGFLAGEARRQERLKAREKRPWDEVERLVDALQFCDLVSLYLCSGATADVEFPRGPEGGAVRLRREDEACVFEPSPFPCSFDLAVPARRARDGRMEGTTFSFFAW